MKVLAVASQKGGSGKSTIAIHIAVMAQMQGIEVLIADLDPHSQTAAEWAGERDTGSPLVITAHEEDLEALQKQASSEGFGLLVLDCPPYVDSIVKTATKIADFTLIPAQPRFADIRTLPRVVESVHPPFSVILNACQPGHNGMETTKTREARQLLTDSGIPVAKPTLTRRESLADSLNGGEAVIEFEPNGKAAAEIEQMWNWIKGELHL